MKLGPYEVLSRTDVPGGGQDVLARDESGQEIRLWVGADGLAPDPEAVEADRARVARIYHATLPRPLAAEVIDGRAVWRMVAYRGRTLREVVDEGSLDVPAALDVVRKIAAGLAKAHPRGVFHGALDAGEILVTDEGRPVLLRLGFAAYLNARELRAPEDAEGPTETGDVYGLSRILFESVVGVDPGSPGSTPPASPDELPSDLPEGLRRFLVRALRPRPTDRFRRAEELAGDLGVIRASWDSLENPVPAPERGNPGRWIVGALFVAALGLGFVLRSCAG